MANEMKLNKFGSKEEAVTAIGRSIIEDLTSANQEHKESRILLSGGSTPGPVYSYINKYYNEFDRTHFGLVDERFVPTDSPDSNERLIKTTISNVEHFTGMVFPKLNYSENIDIARKKNEAFKERTDVVVLGMGGDGHTASLFPKDPSSTYILEGDQVDLFNTNAPTIPTRRISCSKKMILNAKKAYLLIFGEEKLQVLQDTKKNLPIHTLIREREDIMIYYA